MPEDASYPISKSMSAASSVTDNAADERRKPDNEPWQPVEVLVTSACPRALPARRTPAGSLEPGDKEEKNAGACQQPAHAQNQRRPATWARSIYRNGPFLFSAIPAVIWFRTSSLILSSLFFSTAQRRARGASNRFSRSNATVISYGANTVG